MFGTAKDILSAAADFFSSLRQLLNGLPDFGTNSKIRAIMQYFSRFSGCNVITEGDWEIGPASSVIAFMRKGMVSNTDKAYALSTLVQPHTSNDNPREKPDCEKEGCALT